MSNRKRRLATRRRDAEHFERIRVAAERAREWEILDGIINPPHVDWIAAQMRAQRYLRRLPDAPEVRNLFVV